MRIKLLTALATNLRAYQIGEEVDWPDKADALRLIEAGYAKPVDEARKRQ